MPCKFHNCYCVAALTFAVQQIRLAAVWDKGTQLPATPEWGKEGGQNVQETAMKLFSLSAYLRARKAYWSVVEELSHYTDRELHDIGIDRADIHEIATLASKELKVA